MKIPGEVKAKILEYVVKYPFPTNGVEASQEWVHNLCRQLRFSFPPMGWGHKRASETRPHSSGVIALDTPFVGWDILVSAGTPDARLELNGDSIDLTGQYFETVTPYNYLVGDEPEEPEDPLLPVDYWDKLILAELKAQTEILKLMAAGMAELPKQINETFSKGVKIRF